MKISTQKGFTIIELLAVITIVSLISLAGIFVWKGQSSDNSEKTNAVSKPSKTTVPNPSATPKASAIDTSAWAKHQSLIFSFRYPADSFTSFVNCTNEAWVYSRSENKNTDPTFSSKVTVENQECGGFGDYMYFYIEAFDVDGTSKRGVSAPEKLTGESTTFKAGEKQGEKICSTNNEREGSRPNIVKQCQYILKNDYNQVWASYLQIEGAPDRTELIDAVVSTIEFGK